MPIQPTQKDRAADQPVGPHRGNTTVAGIFISRGMTLVIPDGGLRIGFGHEGKSAGSLTLLVGFDVCPTWVELSLRHLQEAKAKRIEREAAWVGKNEKEKAITLEREFESSMQAIMAAAIAIDAFYSIIQTYIILPPGLVQKWRTRRTSRYSQVTEVLRRAFHLKPKGTAVLREYLKEIYRVRDLAVHPSGKIKAPILHPELKIGVEWRFAYFSARNAELIVNAATKILWDLAHRAESKDTKIAKYMSSLRQRLVELFPNGHPATTGP